MLFCPRYDPGSLRQQARGSHFEFFGGKRHDFAPTPDIHGQAEARVLNDHLFNGRFERHFGPLFQGQFKDVGRWLSHDFPYRFIKAA